MGTEKHQNRAAMRLREFALWAAEMRAQGKTPQEIAEETETDVVVIESLLAQSGEAQEIADDHTGSRRKRAESRMKTGLLRFAVAMRELRDRKSRPPDTRQVDAICCQLADVLTDLIEAKERAAKGKQKPLAEVR